MPPRKAPLRAVKADEKAAPAKPRTLAEAAESGTHLEFLLATQREMIRDLRDMTGPAKAALYRQILLNRKEIESLEAAATDGPEAVVADTDDEAWNGTGY